MGYSHFQPSVITRFRLESRAFESLTRHSIGNYPRCVSKAVYMPDYGYIALFVPVQRGYLYGAVGSSHGSEHSIKKILSWSASVGSIRVPQNLHPLLGQWPP